MDLCSLGGIGVGGGINIQGDQIYMAVCFWYLVESDFSSELVGPDTEQVTIWTGSCNQNKTVLA